MLSTVFQAPMEDALHNVVFCKGLRARMHIQGHTGITGM